MCYRRKMVKILSNGQMQFCSIPSSDHHVVTTCLTDGTIPVSPQCVSSLREVFVLKGALLLQAWTAETCPPDPRVHTRIGLAATDHIHWELDLELDAGKCRGTLTSLGPMDDAKARGECHEFFPQ
jgi:hypothetical protein